MKFASGLPPDLLPGVDKKPSRPLFRRAILTSMTRFALRLALAAGVAGASIGRVGLAQDVKTKPPTAADWAALARLPDFTGVWEAGGGGGRGGAAPAPAAGGVGARAGVPGGAPSGAGGRAAPGAPGGAAARGRAAGPAGPALTPEYAAQRKARQDAAREDSDAANCLPPGMPGIMGQPYPMEFLLTPGQVTIVIEAYQQVRHIYTDGRPLPADPDPKFHGTSVGRWEGDTLVVDTIGFSPMTLLAANTPHSGKMRIAERFRLTDPDTMTIETTVTDPEALTAPFVSTRTLRRHRDWTLAEYICEENNRNSVDQNGRANINLAAPGNAPKK
jgi:hypothetical protein